MQVLHVNHLEAGGGRDIKALTIHEIQSDFNGSETLPLVLSYTLFELLLVFLFYKQYQW